MKSIRNFAYASLLTLSALNFVPSLASAQNASGKFKLPHDVRWQNAAIPAGDYKFTVETKGATELLTLSKISGASAGRIEGMVMCQNRAHAPAPSISATS